MKAFAGSAPITRASGKKTVITHRHIKNRRLAAAGSIWAMAALNPRPERGDTTMRASQR
ncbi:hypothetical protein ACFC0F_32105 [Rhodococcus qingshengii]|uniref:hypothetical protein n=1 Tax=Rhodococcus qingshengii TaxID=334542 RepID=UPI0035E34586